MSIVSEVQQLVEDTSARFFTTPQVYDAINETQLKAYAESKWQRVSASLVLNTGVEIVSIPPTILVPEYIEYNNGAGVLMYFPGHRVELLRFRRDWRNEDPSQPKHFIIWDTEHLRVFPVPDQTYTMTLWGVGWPVEISGANPDVVADPNYKKVLVNESGALLLELSRPDISDLLHREANERFMRFKTQIRNHQSHNIRVLRPYSPWQHAQSGNVKIIRSLTGVDRLSGI